MRLSKIAICCSRVSLWACLYICLDRALRSQSRDSEFYEDEGRLSLRALAMKMRSDKPQGGNRCTVPVVGKVPRANVSVGRDGLAIAGD